MSKILILIITILVSTISSSQVQNNRQQMLQPRYQAPEWQADAVLPDESIKKLTSQDFSGKYLVLLFYPFDFTYVCPTELIAFSDSYQKFYELDTQVVGISVDSPFTHLAWIKSPRKQGGLGKMNFPLVSDITKSISRQYGVLVENSDDEDLNGAALRGLYIIDQKGTIRSVTINDAPVGRSVDETIRLVQAFKHTDEFGEVCPANWKPGSKTIIPDQAKKMRIWQLILNNNFKKSRGTPAFGKKHQRTHTLCRRCGKNTYHKQKNRCASCGFPDACMRRYDGWAEKVRQRRGMGTGRLRFFKSVGRRAKNGFRDGTTPKPKVRKIK